MVEVESGGSGVKVEETPVDGASALVELVLGFDCEGFWLCRNLVVAPGAVGFWAAGYGRFLLTDEFCFFSSRISPLSRPISNCSLLTLPSSFSALLFIRMGVEREN